MTTSDIVNKYIEYKKARRDIRRRNNLEMESELLPWKEALAHEIRIERKNHVTIREIGEIIGNRNPNFVYSILKAAKEPDVIPDSEIPGSEPVLEVMTYPQVDIDGHGNALITLAEDTDTYILVPTNGKYKPRDEWATLPTSAVKQLRKILADLNGNQN